MRLLVTFSLLWIGKGVLGQQTPKDQIAALAAKIPSCAISCYKTGDAAAGCTGDPVCGCGTGYDTISSIVVPCVEAACTLTDAETCGTLSTEICNIVKENPGLSYANTTTETGTSTAVSIASTASAGGEKTTAIVRTTLSTSVSSQAVATETSTSSSGGTGSSTGSGTGSETGSGSNSGSSSSSSSNKTNKKKGLSGGAIAGIAIGAAAGALLISRIIRLAIRWGKSSKYPDEKPSAPAPQAAPLLPGPVTQYPRGKVEMGPGNPVTPSPPSTIAEKSNVGVGILDLNHAPLTTEEREELNGRRRAAELEDSEAAMMSPATEGSERAELEARRRAAGVVHELG